MTDWPLVSVVIATSDAARTIDDCIVSVLRERDTAPLQVIVVDASADGTANIVEAKFPDVLVIRAAPGTLTPRLWSAGLAAATGEYVAFMTGHTTVRRGWNASLREAFGERVAGAGGPIALHERASITDAAIYFLRYSAFMPSTVAGPCAVSEIAGDNSMYRGDLLRRHMSTFSDGFWEVPFHHVLRQEGYTLRMVPASTIDFSRSFKLPAISAQRFAHGRHFAAWRIRNAVASRARIILGSPLVPFILLARIARRVSSMSRSRGSGEMTSMPRFVAAAPVILWLGACWAFGEALGALET